MPQLSFFTLDVFTTTRYEGNPLAVVRVPSAGHEDLSTEQMQLIAKEFNLSETLFLYESTPQGGGGDVVPEWRVRIFLTTAEIPFAGHPIIGCAVYALGTLAAPATKGIGRLLCPAGTVEARYDATTSIAEASIPHNVHIHVQNTIAADYVLHLQPGLQTGDITEDGIALVSPVKGMNFLLVELPNLDSLARVGPSAHKPLPKLDDEWNVGFTGSFFYVDTSTSSSSSSASAAAAATVTTVDAETISLRTRMIEGTLEDLATGSASCALASYLALMKEKKKRTATKSSSSSSSSTRTTHFSLTQGVEMGRKSEVGVSITLDAAAEAVEKVALSGSAVLVMSGVVEY